MLSSSKCVLVLSDEGLNVYDVAASKTILMDTIPWETQDFEDTVADIIRHKMRGRSLILFNDMVEQHYRKERIPKISALDRANIVERRLTAAFPSYPMRAALRLKDKSAAAKGETGDVYLFAAVPLSDNVRKTLSAVRLAHATVSGFGLLPVESASMVQILSKKLGKGLDRPSVWSVFVGQHQSGGLRQVVTRNGELALTRMTPIIDSDDDPDVWAAEVVTEIKGTMSYLSRFGFDANDGLDVTVIASNATADLISSNIDFDCNLNVLTAAEAGSLLGLRLGVQKEQRYADPLHISWVGKKSTLTLPLKSAAINDIARPMRVAMVSMVALLCIAGYLGYLTMDSYSVWKKSRSQLAGAQQSLETTRTEHSTEMEAKKAAGVDFEKIDKTTKIYDLLDKQSLSPLVFLDKLGRALGPDIALQSLTIKPSKALKPGDEGYVEPVTEEQTAEAAPAEEAGDGTVIVTPESEPGTEYEVVLRILFPEGMDPKLGVTQVNELFARLQKAFPEYKMEIIKQVADLSYTGNFVGQSSTIAEPANNPEKLEAEIMIRGILR